jgi:hypothetical protein
MTKHGMTEENTRDRGTCRNLVLGEGKYCRVEKSLGYDDDDDLDSFSAVSKNNNIQSL